MHWLHWQVPQDTGSESATAHSRVHTETRGLRLPVLPSGCHTASALPGPCSSAPIFQRGDVCPQLETQDPALSHCRTRCHASGPGRLHWSEVPGEVHTYSGPRARCSGSTVCPTAMCQRPDREGYSNRARYEAAQRAVLGSRGGKTRSATLNWGRRRCLTTVFQRELPDRGMMGWSFGLSLNNRLPVSQPCRHSSTCQSHNHMAPRQLYNTSCPSASCYSITFFYKGSDGVFFPCWARTEVNQGQGKDHQNHGGKGLTTRTEGDFLLKTP